ncbi:MAG: FixH family protein [Blastocatellia bacterium]
MLKGSLGKPLTLLVLVAFGGVACSRAEKASTADDGEALSRTEFTERIENYFEFDPLKAGKKSQFLIHLTDLSDGSPVEQAEVTLTMRSQGSGAEVAQTRARIGKVTGIYVAEVAIPNAGNYAVEFHVKNEKLEERMPLTDFKVE